MQLYKSKEISKKRIVVTYVNDQSMVLKVYTKDGLRWTQHFAKSRFFRYMTGFLSSFPNYIWEYEDLSFKTSGSGSSGSGTDGIGLNNLQ